MAAPVPIDFIKAIHVSQLTCPLYDHMTNPPTCYYGLGEQPIWEVEDRKAFPAATTKDTTFTCVLSDVGKTALTSMTPPYILTATLGTMSAFDQDFSSPQDTNLSDLKLKTPTVNGVPGGTEKSLPWRIAGQLSWILKGTKAEQPQYQCQTMVEAYVLPANLPHFYDISGIPLALLREAKYLPIWMSAGDNDWAAFAVRTMFNDDRLEYETFNGSSKYTSSKEPFRSLFAGDNGIECWLDLWLSDLAGVQLQKARHTVNCYDLAALCQAVIAVGIDSKIQDLRMKFMEPFGYIKKTKLIGRTQNPPDPVRNPDSLCNNPFYKLPGNRLSMLCDDDAPLRSAFGNHMFLTITKGTAINVLDACCGPQVGTVSLSQYPRDVIDDRPARYEPRSNPYRYKLGSLNDITDGVGIGRLVTSRCFQKSGDPSKPGQSLLDKLASRFSTEGTWYQPYLSAPQGNGPITVTWTFKPTSDPQEVITVNVFGYADYDAYGNVQREYNRRKNAIEGWQASSQYGDDDAFNDMVDGSSRMFYNASSAVYPAYFCAIDARIAKSSNTLDFREKIQEVLDNSLNPSRGRVTFFDSVIPNPSEPIKIGNVVSLRALAKPKEISYWRGFSIQVPRNNVLFLNCAELSNGVDFHLLARKPGFVTVFVTMYGGNLDFTTRDVNLQVING